MVTVALLIRLEAKPGKEAEVESFLKSGLPIVEEEPATTAWFGARFLFTPHVITLFCLPQHRLPHWGVVLSSDLVTRTSTKVSMMPIPDSSPPGAHEGCCRSVQVLWPIG